MDAIILYLITHYNISEEDALEIVSLYKYKNMIAFQDYYNILLYLKERYIEHDIK